MSAEQAPKSHETLNHLEHVEHQAKPKSPEQRAELLESDKKDRNEKLSEARAKLDKQSEPGSKVGESEKAAHVTPPVLDRLASYKDTMRSLQRKLRPASRSFSKVIHNPAIEKTSEVVGATVARPSITLGATVTAALVGGVMYWAARTYGFTLSGAELLFAMLAGGVMGFLIEIAIRAFGRRPQ